MHYGIVTKCVFYSNALFETCPHGYSSTARNRMEMLQCECASAVQLYCKGTHEGGSWRERIPAYVIVGQMSAASAHFGCVTTRTQALLHLV
jgi:hypothetical protein